VFHIVLHCYCYVNSVLHKHCADYDTYMLQQWSTKLMPTAISNWHCSWIDWICERVWDYAWKWWWAQCDWESAKFKWLHRKNLYPQLYPMDCHKLQLPYFSGCKECSNSRTATDLHTKIPKWVIVWRLVSIVLCIRCSQLHIGLRTSRKSTHRHRAISRIY